MEPQREPQFHIGLDSRSISAWGLEPEGRDVELRVFDGFSGLGQEGSRNWNCKGSFYGKVEGRFNQSSSLDSP